MSKAIIVIDMPNTCSECRFIRDHYDYPECSLTGESRGYMFRTTKQRMNSCPLRELTDNDGDKDVQIIALKERLLHANETLSKAYQIIGEVIEG